MAMEESGLSIGDALALTKDNDGLFGGNGIMALIIIFILLFGGNGFGFNGNRGYEQYATQQGVQNAFDTNTITNKLDGISNGLCSLGYENAQLIGGVTQGINTIGYQMQNCCCENQRLADKNTRDILEAICADGQATRALITENEMNRLRTDLQSAQLTLANANQTQNILSSLGIYRPYSCFYNNGVTVA